MSVEDYDYVGVICEHSYEYYVFERRRKLR